MTYFPTDVFQIIKSFINLNGLNDRFIKLINNCSVNDLKIIIESTTGKTYSMKIIQPAKKGKRLMLRDLFQKNYPLFIFNNMIIEYECLTLKLQNKIIDLGGCGEIIFFPSKSRQIICGSVFKINKKSIIVDIYDYTIETRNNTTYYVWNKHVIKKRIRLADEFHRVFTPNTIDEVSRIIFNHHGLSTWEAFFVVNRLVY